MGISTRSGWLIFVLSIVLTGCGTTAKFVYPANAQNLIRLYETPKYGYSVAVVPFEEARSDKNQSAYWAYLIPLVPYGTNNYERPDAARMFVSINEFTFNVSEDLAKAAVVSLQKSNLFRNVYFSYGGDADKADFILKGVTKSTQYQGKIYSYCLSVYGPLLWFIGLPAGTSQNRLSLDLSLAKTGSNSSVWKYSFDREKSIVQGLYYSMGYDVRNYTTLMEAAMNGAVEDLDKQLPDIVK